MTAPKDPTASAPIPVIVDTDPGIDDTLALLLALKSPELDVRGVSVTYGNTVVENAHRNAVEILRAAGRRLPLAVGARRPLKRTLAVALETHGASGLGHAKVPPAGVVLDFAKTLFDLLRAQSQPVTLVTLGPVTGLALALRRDAALVREKVGRHIAMIGNLRAAGNTTAYSEFNAWCDPEALAIVLGAELPTEMVGLDVTRQMTVAGPDIERLAQVGDPQARWLSDILRFYLEFHRQYDKFEGCVIHDVLPIASLIEPSVLQFEPLRIKVDLEDGEPRGRTRIDPDGARVDVATGVDPAAARQLLFERVLPWLTPAGMAGGSRR